MTQPPAAAMLPTVLAALEHTLLAPDATAAEIDRLCDEARALGVLGVCVASRHVARCRRRLRDSASRVVSVVGFPLGSQRSEVKAHEARLAVEDGADELDMVIDLAAARAGEWGRVQDDVRAVVEAGAGRSVKLIVETAVLEEREIRVACRAAVEGGAAFVKTSTGFAARGASVADVRLMRDAVQGRAGVKASGGIRDAEQALSLLAAGATRLGTSAARRIVTQLRDPAMLRAHQGD